MPFFSPVIRGYGPGNKDRGIRINRYSLQRSTEHSVQRRDRGVRENVCKKVVTLLHFVGRNNNNNDRLTAFDPGQPG